MVYNASADLWYQYFVSDGSQWLILLSVFGFRSLWATFALIFNFGVVFVTVKNKNLRSSCNILIALECFLSFMMDFGFYVSFLVSLSTTKFIRYEQCFWFLVVPCFFGDMTQITMVIIAIDRLIAVAFPIWFNNRSTKKYFAVAFSFILCYGLCYFALRYIDYINSKNIMVSCSYNEMGQSFIGPITKIIALVLSGTLMLTYSLCWFLVFKLPQTSRSVDQSNRKVIKALLFIIGLNLIGVFIRLSTDLLFQYFVVVNVFVRSSYSIAFSFLTIIVYGANGPLLYIISSDYRTHFKQQFLGLTKLFGPVSRTRVVFVSTSTFK